MHVDIPKKIAFVAMPFGKRKVLSNRSDAPASVDFDAVWNQVLAPTLEDLNYIPVRADEQTGSVIVKDMLEQLVYADLVIADISIDNANVYYEAGIRHAASSNGCVLIGADWAEPVFDLAQIRQVRYPYDSSGLTEDGIKAAKDAVRAGIEVMRDSISPVYDLTPYPDPLKDENQSIFATRNAQIAKFQKAIRIANMKSGDEAIEAVESIKKAFTDSDRKSANDAQQVYILIRDKINWESSIEFIKSLPGNLQKHPFFQEQYALVMCKNGEPDEAIDTLNHLISNQGKTPERLGLLGGRYKSLYYLEENNNKKAGYLQKAIAAYDEGMRLDLNQYYCACNLPRLLKFRAQEGDVQQAKFVAKLVVQVCDYRIKHGTGDGWEYPSLIGAAFDTENVDTAKRISKKITSENYAKWSLKTTIIDLEKSVSMVDDEELKGKLEEIIFDLKEVMNSV